MDHLLNIWKNEPTISENIVLWKKTAEKTGTYDLFPEQIDNLIQVVLESKGITSLYSHQVEAFNLVQNGKNVVIATGTASGKTLCFTLPILNDVLQNPNNTALFVYPTKALANDQRTNFSDLLESLLLAAGNDNRTIPTINAEIYDGDTPSHKRKYIRQKARWILTNPDMLHTSILPHHTLWQQYFQSLKFIVFDELHIYRGVFGSHVANVIRRLNRILSFYGATPQFIFCSATISNPKELAEKICGKKVELIDQDGAPNGEKNFIIYNPPIIDQKLGVRKSLTSESNRLGLDLLASSIQTIFFARSRRTVEIVLTALRQLSHQQKDAIRGYRSGYLPKERREIENGLRNGSISAVIATNALELGIDIGGIEAVILMGYPGTIAATRQQSGRAGRKRSSSLALFITSSEPLDQYLAHHPDYIFENSPEQALINPDNPFILLQHIRCASFELPFSENDSFGDLNSPDLAAFLQYLVEEGIIRFSGSKYYWVADQYPASTISLRTVTNQSITLIADDNGNRKTIGMVDYASALWMVHPHAIYLHEGISYQVTSLDLEKQTAFLENMELDYFTEPLRETTIEKVNEYEQQEVIGGDIHFGEIIVHSRVVGYKKIKWYTNEVLSTHSLDMPQNTLQTTAYWLILSDTLISDLQEQNSWNSAPNQYGENWNTQRNLARKRDDYTCQLCGAKETDRAHDVHHMTPFRTFNSFQEANQLKNLITLCHTCHKKVESVVRVKTSLGGLAYILKNLSPLFLMCDVNDLGVFTDPQNKIADGKPVIVLYDQYQGGIGLSNKIFSLHKEIMQKSLELVKECSCNDGCPSCLGPAGENGSGSKRETIALLEGLNGIKSKHG